MTRVTKERPLDPASSSQRRYRCETDKRKVLEIRNLNDDTGCSCCCSNSDLTPEPELQVEEEVVAVEEPTEGTIAERRNYRKQALLVVDDIHDYILVDSDYSNNFVADLDDDYLDKLKDCCCRSCSSAGPSRRVWLCRRCNCCNLDLNDNPSTHGHRFYADHTDF